MRSVRPRSRAFFLVNDSVIYTDICVRQRTRVGIPSSIHCFTSDGFRSFDAIHDFGGQTTAYCTDSFGGICGTCSVPASSGIGRHVRSHYLRSPKQNLPPWSFDRGVRQLHWAHALPTSLKFASSATNSLLKGRRLYLTMGSA